jgi:hypothetical protein
VILLNVSFEVTATSEAFPRKIAMWTWEVRIVADLVLLAFFKSAAEVIAATVSTFKSLLT